MLDLSWDKTFSVARSLCWYMTLLALSDKSDLSSNKICWEPWVKSAQGLLNFIGVWLHSFCFYSKTETLSNCLHAEHLHSLLQKHPQALSHEISGLLHILLQVLIWSITNLYLLYFHCQLTWAVLRKITCCITAQVLSIKCREHFSICIHNHKAVLKILKNS